MRSPHELYASPSDSILAQESSRTFMQRVYGWMTAGLALTGVTAMIVASQPQWLLMARGLMWPIVIGQFLLVIALSAVAHKVSTVVAAAMFLAYSFTTGLLFSFLFYVYTQQSIAAAFFVTSGAFAALSIFGVVTKRNLSAMSTFLVMGLVGLVIAGVVNIFLQSSMLSFVSACIGVLVFAGLTAWDTQRLKMMHAEASYASAGSLAIRGALTLYLDFINLFISLLRLFGRRRD